MEALFKACKVSQRDSVYKNINDKLQDEANSIRVDDYEAYLINSDIVNTYKSIYEKIDLLKKKAEGRSEVKSSKDDEKKLNKLKTTQEMLKVKYHSNIEQKHVCEKKVERIDNEIDEIKEKYDVKENDIREKAEKKIETLKRKIEELEKDIEKTEEDTENKLKILEKARRKSIDKRLEDKQASMSYIEDVLDKRHDDYETQLTNITNEYDTMSNSAKLCLLASDIKLIEESKNTIKNKIQTTNVQLETYNSILPKLEKLREKYFVDHDDYDEKTYNYIDKCSGMIKGLINDIKSYPDKLNLLLDEINKIM
jgi:chromosome segregation ATPase